MKDNILGGLYGSLIGDALGVPVEFTTRAARELDPVVDMRGFGTHKQPAGAWSDDGALMLCSVESLIEKGFNTQDMGERFVNWYRKAHWTSHGVVFDIGNVTKAALHRVELGMRAEMAGGMDLQDNGNGSLMRILPVVLASLLEDEDTFMDRIVSASSITHRHRRSQMACVFYGLVVRDVMRGFPALVAYERTCRTFQTWYNGDPEVIVFEQLLAGDLPQWPISRIKSGGYVLETLTASLWCFLTTNTFAGCVLKAVNLGEDTDTTGCVAGGIAGVYYGLKSIPQIWIATLPKQVELTELFYAFLAKQ